MEQPADHGDIGLLQAAAEFGHHVKIATVDLVEIAARQDTLDDITVSDRRRIACIIIAPGSLAPPGNNVEIRHMRRHREYDAILVASPADCGHLLTEGQPTPRFFRRQTEISAFHSLHIKADHRRIIPDCIIRIRWITAAGVHLVMQIILMTIEHRARATNTMQESGQRCGPWRCLGIGQPDRSRYLQLAAVQLLLRLSCPDLGHVAIRVVRPGSSCRSRRQVQHRHACQW